MRLIDVNIINVFVALECLFLFLTNNALIKKQKIMQLENLEKVKKISSDIKAIDEEIAKVDSFPWHKANATITLGCNDKELPLRFKSFAIDPESVAWLYIHELKKQKNKLIKEVELL